MSVVDLIKQCENRLGWQPRGRQPIWKERSIEAGRLKRIMAERGYTEGDLQMAIDYSWHRREPIDSPVGLIYRVEAAKEYAHREPVLGDVETRIAAAVDHEIAHPRPDSDYWTARLLRARGEGRAAVLAEWNTSRGAQAA